MKTIKAVRDIHAQMSLKYERLQCEVKDKIKPLAENRGWFFLSRLKSLESYALKIETGRIEDPLYLEDFLGCTIVVPTMMAISEAEKLVCDIYDLDERRPPNNEETRKESSNFRFDDVRIYVTRRPSSSGKDEDLDGLKFEVQIKTILQHAWSIATHDLIYKTNSVSWPKERIAFQVKAMLEHAEIAIAHAENLSEAPGIAKSDLKTRHVAQIIYQIQEFWSADKLPNDVKRLSEIFYDLAKTSKLETRNLINVLKNEKTRIGALPSDLSPYSFFLQALSNDTSIEFERKFKREGEKLRIVVHGGMDIPRWMFEKHVRIISL